LDAAEHELQLALQRYQGARLGTWRSSPRRALALSNERTAIDIARPAAPTPACCW